MTFVWPIMLFWLVLIPAFPAIYVWMQQRRQQLVALYGNPGLVQEAAGRRVGARRHIPPLFFLAALVVLIVAMARPQATVSLPRLEGSVILAFDVSGSMAADDLKPSRMEAAKAAAREFVQDQPSSVQIGVVTFSDGGFTAQPPTDDQAAVLASIERLTVQRGTSLARGIEASLNVLSAGEGDKPQGLSIPRTQEAAPTATPVPKGTYTSAVIVLLTDGENNQEPDPLEAAQAAADRGVRIHTVGVGSTAGATLRIEGFSVRSRLDEETLQRISEMTGGTYYNAANEEDLHAIYDNLDPELAIKPQKMEMTSLFAGAGILILILGSTLSLLWLGRLP
ncbi:MAG TPA: VWA domain-containing protein [Chloroflexia bacterium]|nr:VWA domain-containing protein [Chloroflexia bacterium]